VTHLPYIAGAYVIAVGMSFLLSIEALFRVQSARHRLQKIDMRRERRRP
jgi:hypothetical protein